MTLFLSLFIIALKSLLWEKLSDEQKNGIKNQLRSILGEKLFVNYNVDKKILGGLIVKIGSKMIDSSLNSKINKLTIAMKGA